MRCSTRGALETVVPMRATEGSNLAPSSSESRANLTSTVGAFDKRG
jgi:hypothetical protein